jgi:hypothetical protein
MLGAVSAGALIARDRAATRAASAAGASSRAAVVSWGGVPGDGEGWHSLDATVEPDVRRALGVAPTPVALYRETRVSGVVVDLGAVNGIARWVELESGRMPRPCRAAPCEVVRVGGGAVPLTPGVVEVGRGRLRSDALFGKLLGTSTGEANATRTFLLANGVAGLSRLTDWDGIYRTYGWVVPLAPDAVHLWQIDAFGKRVDALRTSLAERSDFWSVAAPDQQLAASRDATSVAGRRLLLVGGNAVAVLLAFVVLAAVGLRRDAEASRSRLLWLGARRWQTWLVSAAEMAALGLAGGIVGWAIGCAVAWATASRAGVPAGGVIEHSTLAWSGLALGAVVAVTAALALLVALVVGPVRVESARVTALDAVALAALAALAALGIALARGAANADALARNDRTGVVLFLLPALVTFVAAAVLARILVASVRLLERLARGRSLAFRLAAVSLARRPGAGVVAAVFVLVGSSLAIFAAAYAGTLRANERDQAAQAVPADYVVAEDLTRLVSVQRAAPYVRYEALGQTSPVVREDANVSGGGIDLTALGVPARDLVGLHGWRSDLAPAPARLAQLLQPPSPVREHGLRLPVDASAISLPMVLHGDPVVIAASVLTPRGDVDAVPLGEASSTTHLVRAALPAEDRGGLVTGLTFSLPEGEEFTAAHRASGGVGGAGTDVFKGTMRLGPLRASTDSGLVSVGSLGDWLGAGGIDPGPAGRSGAELRYAVGRTETARLRARQQTDGKPVPMVVSPDVARFAGPDGIVPLEVAGESLLGKVVATARLVPGTAGGTSFALADESVLQTALDARSPGLGTPSEIWLRAPAAAAAMLHRAPFDRLLVTSRRALLASLAADPLAHASVLILGISALVAVAIAIAGLLLSLLSDIRDDAGELADLEALGVAPTNLRRQVEIRTALVALAGLAAGAVTGAALGALVVRFVTLTAAGLAPEPPLRLAFPAGQITVYALLVASATAVLVWLVAGIALRHAARDEGVA